MPESDRLYVMTKNYKVDVRLLSTRNLEVKLTKKVSKDDMKLDVTVLLVDNLIEVKDTINKEDTTWKDEKTATVTFPLNEMKQIHNLSFIVVLVRVFMGDVMISNYFSQHLLCLDV